MLLELRVEEKASQHPSEAVAERLLGGDEMYGRHGENRTSSSVQFEGGGGGGCGGAASEAVRRPAEARTRAMNRSLAVVVAVIMVDGVIEVFRGVSE